jgi:hypothetical protein
MGGPAQSAGPLLCMRFVILAVMSSFTFLGKIILAIIVLIIAGVGFIFYSARTAHAPGPVACTMEAMQCPDGTYVGRTGPNCEFVCPTATTTATSTATTTGGGGGFAEYHSGIRGTVTEGPMCPVQRIPPDPACADRPLQTLVTIFRASDPVHAIALTQSDSKGAFQVTLSPGDYVVGAGQSNLPRCAQTPATVGAAGYTQIAISCDTGIR